MLLAQGQRLHNICMYILWDVHGSHGVVCGEMYSCYPFLYGGFKFVRKLHNYFWLLYNMASLAFYIVLERFLIPDNRDNFFTCAQRSRIVSELFFIICYYYYYYYYYYYFIIIIIIVIIIQLL